MEPKSTASNLPYSVKVESPFTETVLYTRPMIPNVLPFSFYRSNTDFMIFMILSISSFVFFISLGRHNPRSKPGEHHHRVRGARKGEPRAVFCRGYGPVSYTHLDVYKRQRWSSKPTMPVSTHTITNHESVGICEVSASGA